jgi:D-xylose transport system ATP-binding protein
MAAQVATTDVTHSQVVELITSGRSGELGLPADNGAEYIDITPDGTDGVEK